MIRACTPKSRQASRLLHSH